MTILTDGTTVPIPKWTNCVLTDLGGRDPLR